MIAVELRSITDAEAPTWHQVVGYTRDHDKANPTQEDFPFPGRLQQWHIEYEGVGEQVGPPTPPNSRVEPFDTDAEFAMMSAETPSCRRAVTFAP